MMSPEDMEKFARLVMPQMIYGVQELEDGLTHQFKLNVDQFSDDHVGRKQLDVFIVANSEVCDKIENMLDKHYGEPKYEG